MSRKAIETLAGGVLVAGAMNIVIVSGVIAVKGTKKAKEKIGDMSKKRKEQKEIKKALKMAKEAEKEDEEVKGTDDVIDSSAIEM